MKLNIIGDNVWGTSGYQNHTRNLAKALYKLNKETSLDCPKPNNWHAGCEDDLFKMCSENFGKEHNVLIQMPLVWKLKASDRPKSISGFLIWEGDKIPKSWAEDCNDNRIKYIFCPSEHTKQASLASGVKKEKIKIIPHGVDTTLFKPRKKEPFANLNSDKFTFLFVGGWAQGKNDRKDFALLLRAFLSEFNKSEPVRILAHINPAYGTTSLYSS